MRSTKYLPLLLLLFAVSARAQAPARAGTGLVVSPQDLLSTPEPGPSGLRLGLQPWYTVLPDSVDLARAFLAPGGPLPLGAAAFAIDRQAGAAARAGAAADTAPRTGGFRDLELPAVVQDIADLRLQVEGRGDMAGAWNRYRPCEPGLRLNCNPGLFPQLRPEVEFGVQVEGTITDRIHVEVDYDQRREFDAANSINVYYQGMPGEALQRLEMGDVSIDLPASRYLTQGIPAGNFGFKASTLLGPAEVEAVWAQQRGDIATREFRLGGVGQSGLVQDQELVLDDADYAAGQFFFLVDPRALTDWPHVDVLTLDRGDAPATVRPRPDQLVVYRDEGASASRYADQAQTGKFLADAVTADGALRHSGLFTLLEPGEDYYAHSSGLWIALRAPLRDDEALAIGYVTETGAVVGDPAPESRPPGETPQLRLVRGPVTIHQPGQPTWIWEMHQVYRLDSSAEVETSTLDLVISLGHEAGGATFEEHAGKRIPLLRLFGLDDNAPTDRVDVAHVFRPGSTLEAVGGGVVRGTFIVFPTLEPFGRPPPVPSEGLSAAETRAILGADANPAIYEQTDPVIRQSSTRFRLNFRYRVRLEGLPSSFNLGAFGIRENSERITVEDRLLVRNVDYVIDYDLGLVTLLDPQLTLGSNPDAEIRASWEQKAIFDVAPTTVFGLNARAPLGPFGVVNLVGLYQSEQSMVRRPQLGMAPAAVLLGGASGRLAFQADWLSSALRAVPLLRTDSIARVDVTGELALSAPEPNRQGATYLDDFEATDEIPLSLDATTWQLGSAPQDDAGVPTLPWPLTPDNAASLVWQDRYLLDETEVGFLTPDQIDRQITSAGTRLAERVLHLTLDDRPGADPGPHWRSLTTVLSTTGRDLSRSEYIEFYAAPHSSGLEDALLVIDIGTVSEDAFYFDSTGALQGTAGLGRPWGLGTLDEEASLALRDVWGPDDDRRGLWDQNCFADRLNPVPLGDPRANCTVDNGRPDTEDLNGNGVLDAQDGPFHRYVVPLGAGSPYLLRSRGATQTDFRLFRIPLRGPGAIPLHGASDATWRFVRHMRVTVVKPTAARGHLSLARFRIAGSRWTKRDVHGVLAGLVGDATGVGGAGTNLRVGTVSGLTDGAEYTSPPGVEDEPQDPRSTIGASGAEYNEKSLRLTWDALPAGERAEVYYRYPQQPRSFLEYRSLRFWAVPRNGRWGPDGDHQLLVKLGTDGRNYYLYRSRLRGLASEGRVTEEDWRPEHVIDFATWFALKAEAEARLVEEPGPLVVWSADSTHAVVLEDRARAPNLAAVREVTFAVYNGGLADAEGEVWIDDLRLDAGARDVGVAGRVDVTLNAGGFLAAGVSFGGRGGQFRQLDDSPSYLSTGDLVVNTTAELGRFTPESWGVSMPVTVSYLRTSLDPIFLQGTDVRADRLNGLREPGSSRRRVGITLRKTTPTANPLLSALLDGTALRLGHVSLSETTVTTASRLDGLDGGIEVDRAVAALGFDIVPGFLETALRWIAPRRVERSEFFERLTGARLRLTPERIGLSAAYTSQNARVWRYQQVLERPEDAEVAPLESPRRELEAGARVALRPLQSVTARVAVTSGRDILEPERATTLAGEQAALRRARAEVVGVPLGWERDRVVTTDAAYRPEVAGWFRPSVVWHSRFGQRRDPAFLELSDAVPELQRTFNADRRLSRGVILDPAGMASAALLPLPPAEGDSAAAAAPGADTAATAPPPPWPARLALAALRPIKPLELTWVDEVGSRFERELADPEIGYQVGWGGLDAIRVVDGDTAATALRRNGFRARSGLRLPWSTSLDVGFSETTTRVQEIGAGRRDQVERHWPDVLLSWQELPLPQWLGPVVSGWSFSTGFVRTHRLTDLGGAIRRIRSQTEATVPLELRLGFGDGAAFSYIASFTTGDGVDPAGTTEQQGSTHGVDVSGRFTAPFGLDRALFPEPLRLSVAYDYQAQRQCRAAGNSVAAECTEFIDHLNRRLNLNLSTLVSHLDIGLQASYIDRRSFIGTQAGSSQFRLGLFGQFNLQAGGL